MRRSKHMPARPDLVSRRQVSCSALLLIEYEAQTVAYHKLSLS